MGLSINAGQFHPRDEALGRSWALATTAAEISAAEVHLLTRFRLQNRGAVRSVLELAAGIAAH